MTDWLSSEFYVPPRKTRNMVTGRFGRKTLQEISCTGIDTQAENNQEKYSKINQKEQTGPR